MIDQKIIELQTFLDQKKGKLQTYKEQFNKVNSNISVNRREYKRSCDAQKIIQEEVKKAQVVVKNIVEKLVTKALNLVFPEKYKFCIEYQVKRNKVEVELFLWDNEKKIKVDPNKGGGVTDITAFSLRVALWSLQKYKNNTIILDESFKHLSQDLHFFAGQILKILSDELKIQFIMVSHSKILKNVADKVFEVSLQDGVSVVSDVLFNNKGV